MIYHIKDVGSFLSSLRISLTICRKYSALISCLTHSHVIISARIATTIELVLLYHHRRLRDLPLASITTCSVRALLENYIDF